MSFINTGADEALLKSLYGDSVHVDQDELCKAMNRAGLVQKEVQVRGKNGQTFTRKQWVKASDAQSTQSSSSSQKKTDTDDKKTSDIQFDDFMLTWKDGRGGHVERCKTVEELKDKLKYYGLPESLADFSPKNINKKSIQEKGYTENSYKQYSVCAYPTDDFFNDMDSKSSKETLTNDIPDDLKDKLKHPVMIHQLRLNHSIKDLILQDFILEKLKFQKMVKRSYQLIPSHKQLSTLLIILKMQVLIQMTKITPKLKIQVRVQKEKYL